MVKRRGIPGMSREQLNDALRRRMAEKSKKEKGEGQADAEVPEKVEAQEQESEATQQDQEASGDQEAAERERSRLTSELSHIDSQLADAQQKAAGAKRMKDAHREDWFKGLIKTLRDRRKRTKEELKRNKVA